LRLERTLDLARRALAPRDRDDRHGAPARRARLSNKGGTGSMSSTRVLVVILTALVLVSTAITFM
jgi:hypothetical protein